jgi:RND family efflux transporter MFP subunit
MAMTRTNTVRVLCCFGCAALACAAAFGQETPPSFEAVTIPSKDRTISFIHPGLVAEVLVKDGQAVKKDQLLARLEDSAEQVQLEQLKATAEDDTEIKARQTQLDLAQVELDLKKEAQKKGVAPELEVQRADVQVKIADAQLQIAKFNQKMNKLRYQQEQKNVDRMRLTSPIDGIVETIAVDEGEAVDTQMRPVMRIICIDPMWIEVKVPRGLAMDLRKEQQAKVTFSPGETRAAAGKVIHIGADADSASDTVLVRVEVPNPTARKTGETVKVSFEKAVQSGASRPKQQITLNPNP